MSDRDMFYYLFKKVDAEFLYDSKIDENHYIEVDIGGHHQVCALFNEAGELLEMYI